MADGLCVLEGNFWMVKKGAPLGETHRLRLGAAAQHSGVAFCTTNLPPSSASFCSERNLNSECSYCLQSAILPQSYNHLLSSAGGFLTVSLQALSPLKSRVSHTETATEPPSGYNDSPGTMKEGLTIVSADCVQCPIEPDLTPQHASGMWQRLDEASLLSPHHL